MFESCHCWPTIFTHDLFQVITVDVRNHGSSPHVAEMDYHIMCDDVECLLDKLGIAKAIVLGHSMGGKIAMVMALTKVRINT